MRARRALTVTASVLVVAVAGCGGSDTLSKNDYQNKANAIIKQAGPALNALSTSQRDPKQLAPALDRASAALTTAAADLSKLKPPKDVAADNTKLASAFRFLSTQLGKIKPLIASKNKNAQQQLIQSINSSPQIRDAQVATADLQKKGYKIGTGSP
jgi:hypothetical protein